MLTILWCKSTQKYSKHATNPSHAAAKVRDAVRKIPQTAVDGELWLLSAARRAAGAGCTVCVALRFICLCMPRTL